MKKICLMLLITWGCLMTGQAQQEHQYTQFMYNKLLINPAYSGARGIPFLTAIYRNQWMGFEGAPTSALISFNSPFLTERVGMGLTVSHRSIGLSRDWYGSFAYSYNVLKTSKLDLRLGLMGSMRSFNMDFSKATPLLINDGSLETRRINEFFGNVGAGLYARWDERWYAGFSVPHIVSNKIGLRNINAKLEAKEYPHFYGMAGASFPLSDQVNLMPSVLLKYVSNAPFDADINLNLAIKEKVTFGMSYRIGGERIGESVDLLLYLQATEALGIGIAYDFTLTQIKDYSQGSFEALIQYDLKQNKNNMSNPRFFF